MIKQEINEDTKTLTIEWNNREYATMNFQSWILIIAFVFAIGLTSVCGWVIATDRAEDGLEFWLYVAIVIAAIFIVILPLVWMKRYGTERVEITPKSYRHYIVEYHWLLPCNWPTNKITRFDYGFHTSQASGETETQITLNLS